MTKKSFSSRSREIERCNNLRVRIKTYCRQESLTQVELAEKMKVSKSSMGSFMSGSALSGSPTYVEGMKYLKLRMPLTQCSPAEIDAMENNKFVFTCGPHQFHR